MKIVSPLQKISTLISPRPVSLLSGTTSPLLAKLNRSRQSEHATKNIEAEYLIQTLDSTTSNQSKVEAIKKLITFVEENNFYDPRLVPFIIDAYSKGNFDLKEASMKSLVEIVKKISLHDSELLSFFHSALINNNSTDALWGLRVILTRKSVIQPGLIPSVIDLYNSTKNFNHEAVSLAVIIVYFSQNQTGFKNDFQILAHLPDSKLHKPDSVFLEGGRPFKVESYLNEVILKELPELNQLVCRHNNDILFSTAVIRAEALFRLEKILANKGVDVNDLIPLFKETFKDGYSASRANSLACINTLTEHSDYLNAETLSLLHKGVNDSDESVRENALDALQGAVLRHSVLNNDLQPVFISVIDKEKDLNVLAYGLKGLIITIDRNPIDSKTIDVLIDYANNDTIMPEIRALSLFAIAKQLQKFPIYSPRLQPVLIKCANEKNSIVKANAFLSIANGIKQGLFIDTDALLISNLNNSDPNIRANALLGISYTLSKKNIVTPELIDVIKSHINDEYNPAKINAIYSFGQILEMSSLVSISNNELDTLLYIASRDQYESAKAATYALAVIVNKNISVINNPEKEDRIEILCKVFSSYLSDENDFYQPKIKAAFQKLEKRSQEWEIQISETDEPSRRLVNKKNLYKQALDQISISCHQLYAQLALYKSRIEELETQKLSLELKLKGEKEARKVLEHDINLLLNMRDEKLQGKTLNKLGAVIVLWLIERTFKDHGFELDRIWNDIQAKAKTRFITKKPVQMIFGLSSHEAEDAIESADLFEQE